MKQFLAITIALALLLTAGAVAVERFDDRALFVPPPDAVAEGFVREVASGRYAQARAYLADPSSMSDDDLRALDESLGEPWTVEAKVMSRDLSRAIVNVKMSGPKDAHAMNVRMVFDREWKVASRFEGKPLHWIARRLASKRSLALREFALGIEALQRFVAREPLCRVHECVFGVLALESEPVDPRL